MDHLQTRLEALEQQMHTVNRRLRWWRGLAGGAVMLAVLTWALPAVIAQEENAMKGQKGLAQRVEALEKLLKHFSREKNEIFITGANLHIVNGLGQTDCGFEDEPIPNCPNGLGNLIVGYNELRDASGCEPGDPNPFCINTRTGSHNVVVGQEHNFSRFGGLVVGLMNTISGDFAVVSGGIQNTASGGLAVVSGGVSNTASGQSSSVSGGQDNTASENSWVGGGLANLASGFFASVSGGRGNTASGLASSVSGGRGNTASGHVTSVSGGQGNTASGGDPEADTGGSMVSGGRENTASGNWSTVSGGLNRTAEGEFNWVAGSLVEDEKMSRDRTHTNETSEGKGQVPSIEVGGW